MIQTLVVQVSFRSSGLVWIYLIGFVVKIAFSIKYQMIENIKLFLQRTEDCQNFEV